MRYCTLADLQLAIPLATLIQLSNDDPQADAIDQTIVERMVLDAEEMVDAHLRGRYVLPLDPVPTVIKNMTVNLARHSLYARRPEGADLPDAVVRTYNGAIKTLESIRDGKLTIGQQTGPAEPEPGEIRVRARRQQFSDDLLDKY